MEEVRLAVGEATILTLPGLGSAGYQWSAVVQDGRVAQVAKLATLPGAVPGASGSQDEAFTIKALTAGQTVLWFNQQRVFQPDRPPHAIREIFVRVE